MSRVKPACIRCERADGSTKNCFEQAYVSAGGQSAGSQKEWRCRERHSTLFHKDYEEKNQSAIRNQEFVYLTHFCFLCFGGTCLALAGSFTGCLAGWLCQPSEYRTINTVMIGSKIIVSFIIDGFSPFAKKLSGSNPSSALVRHRTLHCLAK